MWRGSYCSEVVRQATNSPRRRLQIAPALDQFNFVAFRCVDEGDEAPALGPVWPVGKGITFGRCFGRELLQVVDFEGEMSQIRSNDHGAALVEFAQLNFFVAVRRLEKDKLRTAAGGVAPNLL